MVQTDGSIGLKKVSKAQNIERFLFQNINNATNEALKKLEELKVGEGIEIAGFKSYADLRALAIDIIGNHPMENIYDHRIYRKNLHYMIMRQA